MSRLCHHPADISEVPEVPRAQPPPLGELFPEMGIIVKPCWCPFSLSLTSLNPWRGYDSTTPGCSGSLPGWGILRPAQKGLGAIECIILPLHLADRPHSPGENTEAQGGPGPAQGHPTPAKRRSQIYSPGVLDDSGLGCPCWDVCRGLW